MMDEQMMEIADYVESIMGLDVEDEFQNGEVTIEMQCRDDYRNLLKKEYVKIAPNQEEAQAMTDLINGRKPRSWSNKRFIKEKLKFELSMFMTQGYFESESNSIYLLEDNVVLLAQLMAPKLVQKGLVDGKVTSSGFLGRKKTADKKAVEETISLLNGIFKAHELAHRTHERYYTEIFKPMDELGTKMWDLEARIDIAEQNKEDTTQLSKKYNLVKDEYRVLLTFIEGVGEYVKLKASEMLGDEYISAISAMKEVEGSLANKVLSGIMLKALDLDWFAEAYKKGEKFFCDLERLMGENPLPHVYEHMPVSLVEYDNPERYLRRIGWKSK